MTTEQKEKLIALGRMDLVEIHDINQSGYAGINRSGQIVDRRKFPDAVPVQKNSMLNIPESKLVDTDKMPWGKYKGKEMANIPADYFLWLYDNKKCSGVVKSYIEDNMDVLKTENKKRK